MKTVALSILCLLSAVCLHAQPGGPIGGKGREKIIQMRVEYVRDNLGLSEAEQKKFLPLYEENLRKDEAARQNQRSIMRRLKDNYASMSDTDLEKALNDELASEQAQLDAKRAQFEQYKKLIPLKKVVELKMVEHNFRKMLMEKVSKLKPEEQEK